MNRIALLGLAAALLAGCSASEPIMEAGSAIIGGSIDEGDPAIVLLISYPADQSTFDTCTAELIGPSVLLTAAHCLDPKTHPGHTFGVFTGPDASAYPTAAALSPELLPVKSVHVHPDYDPAPPFRADIGVVLLEEALGTPPLPILREALTEAIVGSKARMVGYGQTKYGEFSAIKHEATTVVAALGEDDTLVVGDLDHRSCIGDSGGPALLMVDGVERIAGVDSYAETKGCLEPAHYRRTDLYTGFLDEYAPPPIVDTGTSASSTGGVSDSPGSGGCATAPRPGGTETAPALLVGVLALVRRRRSARRMRS